VVEAEECQVDHRCGREVQDRGRGVGTEVEAEAPNPGGGVTGTRGEVDQDQQKPDRMEASHRPARVVTSAMCPANTPPDRSNLQRCKGCHSSRLSSYPAVHGLRDGGPSEPSATDES